MICSPTSEIAFSQVREDPAIEQQILQRLSQQQRHPLRVLLVASGGCTALSLLATDAIAEVHAVDLNPAQLHLVELRRQALLHLSLEQQLRLIGANVTTREEERSALYALLRPQLPLATQNYWDGRSAQIAFGVNRVGRFEQLFRELSARFAAIGLDPLQRPLQAIQHSAWSSIFEQVFDRAKLIQTFGETAVNYSMDRSFGEHFADVFAHALQTFRPSENYFLTQVWRDRYATGPDGTPPYLQATPQKAIRRLGAHRLHLHQSPFGQAMHDLATTQPFDLIQFSNISDWMPLPDLHQMLDTAVRSLKPGGALLGRRLNGDHHLASVLNEHLPIDRDFSDRLLSHDRSFFYREVVVGFRL